MSPLRQSMVSVAALMLSVSVLLMGSGLLGTLVPVRANLELFSGIDIGILGSFYFLGFTLGCLSGPLLIARVGHIRTYLAFVCVASIAALVHALSVEPWTWWLMRAITGFCFAVLFIVIESWLNERSDNATRGTVFSIYMVINLTVLMIGQMMLTLANPQTFALFAAAAILFSLAALPVAMTKSQSPEPIPVIRPRLIRLYTLSPVGFMGCFAVGLANGAFWSLGAVFAMDRGLNTAGIALFMSAVVLGGAMGQWPLGKISDLVDRRYVILANCVGAALAAIALSLLPSSSETSMLVAGFCFGAFALPLYALSVAHANDFTPATDYVETSSGLLLVLGLGSSIGPTLSSLLDSLTSGQALFMYTAVVHVVVGGFVVWRITRRAPVAVDDKGDFTATLVATQTVAPIEEIKAPLAGAVATP
ncbi:MAG: MFS transporter [Rhodopseudomonas sp.]|nr:MFS transporter [Rhodopseudomonas sp.]